MTETGYDPAAAITEKLKEMSADEAVKMVRELCAQLSSEAESFHGNIWPDNVRIDWEGKAVLGAPSDEPANRREADQVEYLAPEFFWDNEGSAASDVYSLALLLFAACNDGYLPFQPKGGLLTAKDRSGALRKRMKGEPIVPPSDITPELAKVIKRALEYEPEARYISSAEFLRALSETDEALPAAAPDEYAEPAAEESSKMADVILPPVDVTPDDEPAETTPEPGPAVETTPERTLDDVLSEKLEFQELPDEEVLAEGPDEEEETEPEPTDGPEPDEDPDLTEALDAPEEPEPSEAPGDADAAASEAASEIAPEAESETMPEQQVPKYTVQKDFEKDFSDRASVPTANQKKKSSPLIPILCVAAVAVIAAVVVFLQRGADPEKAETADEAAVTYTIEPSQPTEALENVTVTPSLGDDETTKNEVAEDETTEDDAAEDEITKDEFTGEETEEDSEGSGTGEDTPVGSAMIDGLTVEPAGDTVEITDTGANLRTGPGTDYPVAESLSRGAVLTRTGTVNGWSQVQYNGSEYYVASNLVIPVENSDNDPTGTTSPASEATAYTATLTVISDVNIRSGPGTGYSKIGEAKVGATLNAIGISKDGKWYLITTGDGEGYVNRNLVSVQNSSDITELSGTLTVVYDVNLRSGPGTGYEILGTAKAGETFTLKGLTSNNWYQVDYNGQTAYLAGNYGSIN